MGKGIFKTVSDVLFGSDSSNPSVQTSFSNKTEQVYNLLNETLTNIETSIESTTTASNTVGRVNVVATKGSKIKIDLNQNANVQAAQTYMSMIDKIMNSDADTDVALDALMNVAQAVKNDGNIAQSQETAAANISLENSNTTNISNIQKLNQALKLAVATCAVNNFEGGNFLADDNSDIDFKLNQQAESISSNLLDLVTNEKSTLKGSQKEQMKNDIIADNKAEGRGIIAGIGNEIGETTRKISGDVADTAQKMSEDTSSVFKTTGIALIAAIAIPIIIILVIAFVLIYNTVKNNKNRRTYSDSDSDDSDDDYDNSDEDYSDDNSDE